MNIHIREIQDFISCPRLYRLKKECAIPDKEYSSIDEKYTMELQRMVYFFFNQIKNHRYVNIHLVKQAWSDLWVGKRQKEDIFIPTEDPIKGWYRKRERDGLDVLLRFWKHFGTTEQVDDYDIVAVNMPYSLSIGDGIIIDGTIPLVRVKDNKTEIMVFKFGDNDFSLKKDIELTAIQMAFRNIFNVVEDEYNVYMLDRHKLWKVRRHSSDRIMLNENVRDIISSIKAGCKYRALSKRCEDCPYHYYCKEV